MWFLQLSPFISKFIKRNLLYEKLHSINFRLAIETTFVNILRFKSFSVCVRESE